jgi:hypothetical protein
LKDLSGVCHHEGVRINWMKIQKEDKKITKNFSAES